MAENEKDRPSCWDYGRSGQTGANATAMLMSRPMTMPATTKPVSRFM